VTTPNLRIEPAKEQDVPLILEFIRGLATFEKHLEYVQATEERIREAVFGPDPKAMVLIAYLNDLPAACAVYYYTFSTFVGLKGLYLEDLFVNPEQRGNGIGRAMLIELARIAKRERCHRIEWAVLNWNESAIQFYRKLGAVRIDDWAVYRLSDESLELLAKE
jgi:GNAT superfamily N-acetyltransferase